MRKVLILIANAIATALLTFGIWYMCETYTRADGMDTYICEEYQEYCKQVGEELGVSQELLLALMETESSGRADANNNNKYIGLMQVEVNHASDLAQQHGFTDIWEPYTNIYIGCLVLLEKREIDEDVGIALSHYKGYSQGTINKYIENGKLPPLVQKVLDRAYELEEVRGLHYETL